MRPPLHITLIKSAGKLTSLLTKRSEYHEPFNFDKVNKKEDQPSIRIDTFICAAMGTIFAFVDVITFSFIDKFVAVTTCALEGAWCV